MAFYFALFNVSNVNNELKNNKQGKSKGPQHKGNNRRHSVSSTHNLAIDYRLLPRPRVISSNHQLYRPPTPPSSRRRSTPEQSTLCQCELDSDNGKSKKVTFTPSDDGHLTNAPRRYSHEPCLEHNAELSRSMYPEVESSRAQRAAEWIYSISLSDQEGREDRGSMDNGNRSPATSPSDKRTSIPEVVISPGSTSYRKIKENVNIEQERVHVIRPQIIESKDNPPPVPLTIISTSARSPPRASVNNNSQTRGASRIVPDRPPSRLPSILRRRSTSDRSASLTTVFRRSIPYHNLSPKKEYPRRNSSAVERTEPSPRRPSRLPRPSKMQRIRCNFSASGSNAESIPLIQIERNPDAMIRSHIY